MAPTAAVSAATAGSGARARFRCSTWAALIVAAAAAVVLLVGGVILLVTGSLGPFSILGPETCPAHQSFVLLRGAEADAAGCPPDLICLQRYDQKLPWLAPAKDKQCLQRFTSQYGGRDMCVLRLPSLPSGRRGAVRNAVYIGRTDGVCAADGWMDIHV